VNIFVETAGWIGALLILLGYLLVTMGRLTGKSAAFQWMNLIGAAGFTINGWWHRAIPSAALNVIWMMIAAVALGRIWKIKGSSTSAM
jgi:cell shape-determining protein MreD